MAYGRPLDDKHLVERFFTECLGIGATLALSRGEPISLSTISTRVRDAEILGGHLNDEGTLGSQRNRESNFKTPAQRRALRERIVEELIGQDRLADDESIALGSGGAKPIGQDAAKGSCAYLITGLPASGKSTIVATVADSFGAYVIDPDYVKRKLPEFNDTPAGANLVHEESSAIAISAKNYTDPSLLLTCLHYRFNIVRPMVGASAEKLREFRDLLIEQGYSVHLTTILLDRKDATVRALHRFAETNRYVSLGYVFDECANEPALAYYKEHLLALTENSSSWASIGAISTASRPPAMVDHWGSGNPAELFR